MCACLDQSNSYAWHDSFMCVTWHVHVCVAWLIRMCDTRLIHMRDTHSYVRHDSFVRATWFIRTCDMIHSYVRHDSFVCVTCLIREQRVCKIFALESGTSHVRRNHVTYTNESCHAYASVISGAMSHIWPQIWLLHMCDMTHSYVWHDSFICVTWLIHKRDMTHSYAWHYSFICMTWLTHMRDMTHSHFQRHDSSISLTQLIHISDNQSSCQRSPALLNLYSFI